jgi:lipopolysaccharide/colanic/teichoic acid biosynthesis glycosyltransferase
MFLLAVSAPILLAAAAWIRVTIRGPSLFCQTRIGRNGHPFTMFKLRTMYLGCDDVRQREINSQEILGEGGCVGRDGIFKLDNDPRITPVGRFLRRYSIDELPQLFNVLRGEMSLVGPRPSLPWEVELYTAEQRQRHDCLPGLTGLWQVSGRNRRSMQEMLALDVAYAKSRSARLDLWILLRTPYAVLFGRDTR